tara:strand:- start:10312 stop:11484 length:1173 start_codon:yes stop_codon:yes gene_type:complete
MSSNSTYQPFAHVPKGSRLVVAMSGGVDSSVAAWMLKDAGFDLVGLFMRNGVKVAADEVQKKSCCSLSDARDARMVAAGMEIPFQAVDLKNEFGSIIDLFVSEYVAGRTPNPCAVCNRDLKMGKLIEMADDLDAVAVSTGHYAQLEMQDGRVHLTRGVDRKKDQSYQLFCVDEANLARTVLPLGHLEKPVVREMAANAGLRTHKKADSQEVCFVPSNDYRKLLAERGVELHPGDLVDTTGKVLGQHEGTEHFTVGQRRGLRVATGRPMYVIQTVPDEGLVIVGDKEECHSPAMHVGELNWIGVDPPESKDGEPGVLECTVQHRYHAEPMACTVRVQGSEARVDFAEPLLAVAPGQGAAFYVGNRLIGGGWIQSVERLGIDAPLEGLAHQP